MTFAVIVQARMASTRLPGKVLEALGQRTILERCLDRCAMIPGVDRVVVAAPEHCDNDEIAERASDRGYFVSRGDEHDVLSRYAKAAREAGADMVMRVTSDCPFIAPELCGRVADLYRTSHADYVCNNMPPRFPHGVDCDIFSAELLHEADRKAGSAYEREHVTPWMRTNPHLIRASVLGPGEGAERLRWTLDYPEDLEFCRAIYDALGEAASTVAMSSLIRFCDDNPSITAMNAAHIDEARLGDISRAALTTARYGLEPAA